MIRDYSNWIKFIKVHANTHAHIYFEPGIPVYPFHTRLPYLCASSSACVHSTKKNRNFVFGCLAPFSISNRFFLLFCWWKWLHIACIHSTRILDQHQYIQLGECTRFSIAIKMSDGIPYQHNDNITFTVKYNFELIYLFCSILSHIFPFIISVLFSMLLLPIPNQMHCARFVYNECERATFSALARNMLDKLHKNHCTNFALDVLSQINAKHVLCILHTKQKLRVEEVSAYNSIGSHIGYKNGFWHIYSKYCGV